VEPGKVKRDVTTEPVKPGGKNSDAMSEPVKTPPDPAPEIVDRGPEECSAAESFDGWTGEEPPFRYWRGGIPVLTFTYDSARDTWVSILRPPHDRIGSELELSVFPDHAAALKNAYAFLMRTRGSREADDMLESSPFHRMDHLQEPAQVFPVSGPIAPEPTTEVEASVDESSAGKAEPGDSFTGWRIQDDGVAFYFQGKPLYGVTFDGDEHQWTACRFSSPLSPATPGRLNITSSPSLPRVLTRLADLPWALEHRDAALILRGGFPFEQIDHIRRLSVTGPFETMQPPAPQTPQEAADAGAGEW
jgi:hypothetical protein